MAVLIPHLDLPFRMNVVSGKPTAAVVEQDSVEDVANCVEASLRTESGFRHDLPNFGSGDLIFHVQPFDIAAILEDLSRDEPRAQIVLTENPDAADDLIARVTAIIALREGQNV